MVGVSRLLTFKRIALSIAVLLAAVAVAGKLAAAASSEGPSASFTYSPTSPLSGEDISFSSTSSDDGTLTQLQWEFDDGGTADGADVNHTYGTPGVYTVQLTVTDDEGLSNTAQETITVQNRDPSADFHWSPDSPQIDETVFFNSDASDPEDRIEAEKWDLDNDGAFDDHTGSSASRSFSAGGTYTISLLVEDKDGGTATISRTVGVIDPPNQNPNANFTFSPSAPQILDTVTFDSTSTDTDGSIATMEWDFDNDGLYDDATGDKPTRMFFLAGTYTIGLLVTDNEGGTDTVTKNVTVSTAPNDAPVAAFHFAPSSPKTNQLVTFTSDATDDGSIALEEWDFENDGTYDTTGSEVQHSYSTAASYTAKLRVTDDQGVKTSTTKTVNVTEPPNDPPTPAFGFSPSSPQANAAGDVHVDLDRRRRDRVDRMGLHRRRDVRRERDLGPARVRDSQGAHGAPAGDRRQGCLARDDEDRDSAQPGCRSLTSRLRPPRPRRARRSTSARWRPIPRAGSRA